MLIDEAHAADAVINAASSDHRGAVEALIEGLAGSSKTLLHTSGSSIVGDASGGESSEAIYREDSLPEPTADKAPRVAIDSLVLDAAKRDMRSAVLCNTLIYGHGAIASAASVQLPRLCGRQEERRRAPCRAGSAISGRTCISTMWSSCIAARSKRRRPGTFYFIESGEASFREMTAAMADALALGEPQDWPLEAAKQEWGYEMASYGLGSNSRVRGERARKLLGWAPKRTSVVEWIRKEMI